MWARAGGEFPVELRNGKVDHNVRFSGAPTCREVLIQRPLVRLLQGRLAGWVMSRRTSAKNRPQAAIAFGSYRFLPRKRLLVRGSDEVRLGSRALDILGILLDRAGEIVPSAEIISRVWPDTRVEGAALKVHIGLLRKALRERGERSEFIENVAGRGYRFTAPVQRLVERTANTDEEGDRTANCSGGNRFVTGE
jgi:DNA-binding winged helix-turn-helix (wHTH) protein